MAKHNGKRKLKYAILSSTFIGLSLLCEGYAALNLWRWHTFDKYVVKPIEIAANVPSVIENDGSSSDLSMESALTEAKANVGISPLENTGIIWETPLTEVQMLDNLLKKAIGRAKEVGEFQHAFAQKKPGDNVSGWVKSAHSKLNLEAVLANLSPEEKVFVGKLAPLLRELADSEYGQRIGSEYEALNTVVAGGTRTSAKNLEERHRSLLDTLAKAGGWRSIIRAQADEYKETYARVFVGYLMANMGYLSEGLEHFREAKRIMDGYSDDKNLSILRDTPELSQKTIKGLIDSSIAELEALDKDPSKYSTGWWKRLRYYNQSIGGQENPSIQDMAEIIGGRYSARTIYAGGLGLILLYLGGKFGKRWRNAKKYEVKTI